MSNHIKDIKYDEFQIDVDSKSLNELISFWKCPYCAAKIKDSLDKCYYCECKKPLRVSHLSELLICGYCRDVTKDIQYVCFRFYGGRVIEKEDRFAEGSYPRRIKKDAYHSSRFWKLLSGTKFYLINSWRIKFFSSMNCNADHERNAQGIMFGVSDGLNMYGITNEGMLWHGYGGNISSDIRFCRQIQSFDIISISLNIIQKTLSFGINNEWYGVAYRDMETNADYKLCVYFLDTVCSTYYVRLLENKSYSIDD